MERKNTIVTVPIDAKIGYNASDEAIAATVLTPLYLLDEIQSLYRDHIKDLPCKHLANKYKKAWIRKHVQFVSACLSEMGMDGVDEVCDEMDLFHEHIHNASMIALTAIANALIKCDASIPFETRKVLSVCLLCNVLAQCAQKYFEFMRFPYAAAHVDNIRYSTREFMNHYYPTITDMDCNDNKDICAAMQLLCNKIVGFASTKQCATS